MGRQVVGQAKKVQENLGVLKIHCTQKHSTFCFVQLKYSNIAVVLCIPGGFSDKTYGKAVAQNSQSHASQMVFTESSLTDMIFTNYLCIIITIIPDEDCYWYNQLGSCTLNYSA